MIVRIDNLDYRRQSVDVQVVNGDKYDIISGVDEVYLGKKRYNIPSCTIVQIECCAYAVGVKLDGRKVLMVSP